MADRQLAAGAIGLIVATIGEAEAFVAVSATDLFIAYRLWLTGATAAAAPGSLPCDAAADRRASAGLVAAGALDEVRPGCT